MATDVENASDERLATQSKKGQTIILIVIVAMLILVTINAVLRASGGKKVAEPEEARVVMQETPEQRDNNFQQKLEQATPSNEPQPEPETFTETIERLKEQVKPKEQPKLVEQKPVTNLVANNVKKDDWKSQELDRVRESRYDDYSLSLGFGKKADSPNQRLFTKKNTGEKTVDSEIDRIRQKIASNKQRELSILQKVNDYGQSGLNQPDLGLAGINQAPDLLVPPVPTAINTASNIVGQSQSQSINKKPLPGQKLLSVNTFVRAAIDQKVMSDYVGSFRIRITQDVYDVTNTYILIPQGSTVNAQSMRVNNINEPIQARMGYMIKNVVLPNGKLIDFKSQRGQDVEGVSAVKDEVNRHLLAQFLGVAAYALVSNESSYTGSGANSDNTYSGQVGSGTRDIGSKIAQKYLNLVPTITLNPGTSIRIFIEEEMYIYPYASIGDDYVS